MQKCLTITRSFLRFRKNFFCAEIRIPAKESQQFYPIRGVPEFKNGLFTVFEYQAEPEKKDNQGVYQRLQQVPYEIKENSLKTFVYTFFLTAFGRFLSNYSTIFHTSHATLFPYYPASIFAYFYGKTMWLMYNSIVAVHLKEDGQKVVFEFKNGLKPKLEVDIWRIRKKKEENFLLECYVEPYLFPIEVDYTDIYSKYSLRDKRTFYLYGDGTACVKHGEILRAILNAQSIKVK
jgi:hypothetical protein